MMNSQIFQSGLTLANYLQSAFPAEVSKEAGIPSEFERTSPQQNKPPALVRSLIDSGRFYFRLSHEHAVSNLLSLFMPIGKVRQLVPDLYIPVVAICTFVLLRSVYIVSYAFPPPYLGDILGRTATRICFVYILELVVLSVLLYTTTPLALPLDGFRQPSLSTDGSGRSGHASPVYGAEDNRFGYGGGGNFRQFGASSNPFNNYGGQGLAHNQVPAPFGNYGGNVAPLGQGGMPQSQYGNYGDSMGTPRGAMDGHYDMNASHFGAGKQQENDGSGKYFGDNMAMPLSGGQALHLPEKVFIIGYKYVLLNCYILAILVAPIKAVTFPLAAYITVASVMFSLRAVGALNGGNLQKVNPLMFIFPVLQPIWCYILLPHV